MISLLSSLKNWFLSLSWKKKLGLIALILLIGWFINSRLSSQQAQPQYQTAQVTRSNIISTLSESGNVSTTNETNVSSPTDGIIQEVYVTNGDEVAAGDNLFKVKSTATPAEQASAY